MLKSEILEFICRLLLLKDCVNYEWELEVYVHSVFPLSLYVSRRTSDMTLDKFDDAISKSKTVRVVPRIDGVTRRNKSAIGQGSPVAATTAEEPHQAVTETTELPPEPEIGNCTSYRYMQ